MCSFLSHSSRLLVHPPWFFYQNTKLVAHITHFDRGQCFAMRQNSVLTLVGFSFLAASCLFSDLTTKMKRWNMIWTMLVLDITVICYICNTPVRPSVFPLPYCCTCVCVSSFKKWDTKERMTHVRPCTCIPPFEWHDYLHVLRRCILFNISKFR